ncbi:hypothetical protein GCM10023322_48150 [Rugosimonospora acidiphila]|uniref:Uncharacterized protein n=1 Tax=Rugosimonospora acidiphila TaxID=556531 RepID=A0ABP9S6P7_9ACTN
MSLNFQMTHSGAARIAVAGMARRFGSVPGFPGDGAHVTRVVATAYRRAAPGGAGPSGPAPAIDLR